MPRKNFSDGQELVYSDFNNISAAIEREFYDRFLYEILQRTSDAFFGTSFKVSYLSPTSVQVAAGSGVQNDSSAVSPEPSKRPLYLANAYTANLSSPHASLNRIDIVCVRYAEATELSETRKYKSAVDSSISTQSFVVQKDKSSEVLVVAGTPNASPVVPATPAGYIKIAELAVTAVTGMSGSGAVTDKRTLVPIGSEVLLNTLAMSRITQSAAINLSSVIASIDSFLASGRFEYYDLVTQGSDPSSPSAGRVRAFFDGTTLYLKDSSGTKTPVGAGGGGGAGATWYEPEGLAPITTEENGQLVHLFSSGGSEKLVMWLKVPSSYISGRPVKMNITAYSPSSSNNFLMQAKTTLVRKNNDAVDSITNQFNSTNTFVTNSVANRMREISLDLSSSTGGINSVAISAGDLLKIELTRGAPASDDSADVRFVRTATEITFS